MKISLKEDQASFTDLKESSFPSLHLLTYLKIIPCYTFLETLSWQYCVYSTDF